MGFAIAQPILRGLTPLSRSLSLPRAGCPVNPISRHPHLDMAPQHSRRRLDLVEARRMV